MQIPHFKITQAGLIALATNVIGFVFAYVPSWAPDKAHAITTATVVISGVWLIANAIHGLILALSSSKVTPAQMETGVRNIVHDEVSKIDWTALVHQVASVKTLPGLEQLVGDVVGKQLGSLANVLSGGQSTTPAPIASPGPATSTEPPAV